MPKGKDFTPAQWKEINEARARLWAWRETFEPYTMVPGEDFHPDAPAPMTNAEQIIHFKNQELNQLKAQLQYFENRLNGHIDASKKKYNKPIKTQSEGF